MEILIATGNKGKFGEMMEVLIGLNHTFLTLSELNVVVDVDEDGETFVENALKKAEFFYKLAGGRPVIAEDSGIIVDAFPGELGVKTRRWGAGEHATDEEWIDFFLNRINKTPETNRRAKFVCCAVFYDGNEPIFFNGSTEGVITSELQAPIKRGLPLSSCFIPDGHEVVYAALTEEEKNLISHRGKALHALKNFLLNV